MKNTQTYMQSNPKGNFLKFNMQVYENMIKKEYKFELKTTKEMDYMCPAARTMSQPKVRPDSKNRKC